MAAGLIVVSEYIPKREALFVKVDMSDYLIDYYHHRKEHAPDTLAEHDAKLKDLIACFAVHLAARTARETHAWTIHLAGSNPYSLFVTGSTGDMDDTGLARGYIVGNVLTEDIRDTKVNAIHAQFTNRGRTFNSMVQCDSGEIPRMVEQFYEQSEQYPMRIVLSNDSDTAQGVVALPEYDEEWVRGVSFEELSGSDTLERSLMRTCSFEFQCDCSVAKLMPFFQSMTSAELNELYGADKELDISCPRCGQHFWVSRDDLRTEH